jgi:hypothetical protein
VTTQARLAADHPALRSDDRATVTAYLDELASGDRASSPTSRWPAPPMASQTGGYLQPAGTDAHRRRRRARRDALPSQSTGRRAPGRRLPRTRGARFHRQPDDAR